MARNNTFTVKYRRKREGRTNYRSRLKLIASGKPRLVIRRGLRSITLQVVEFNPSGDKVLFSVNSRDLVKLGYKGSLSNSSAAYLSGLLLAGRMKGGECVPDLGLHVSTKGSVLYAALQGVVDGGVKVPCSSEVVPSMDRIRGVHVAEFAKAIRGDKARYERQFGRYLKMGLSPEELPSHFDEIKKKVQNE